MGYGTVLPGLPLCASTVPQNREVAVKGAMLPPFQAVWQWRELLCGQPLAPRVGVCGAEGWGFRPFQSLGLPRVPDQGPVPPRRLGALERSPGALSRAHAFPPVARLPLTPQRPRSRESF